MFEKITRLSTAVQFAKQKGLSHQFYSRYLPLIRVKQMLEGKMIWLTRCDAPLFDDKIEHEKYGDKGEQKKLFFSCFSHTRQESAAMWGLYCPPTYQAIRIVLPQRAMKILKNVECVKINKGKVSAKTCPVVSNGIGDIVYAAVAKDEEESDSRSNTLLWDGRYSGKIEDLFDRKSGKRVTGFVKDAEWQFERESRLWVKIRGGYNENHLALRLPDGVIRSMRFTLSPWIDKAEREFVKNRIRKWLDEAIKGAGDGVIFEESVLTNGLTKWAEQRGL